MLNDLILLFLSSLLFFFLTRGVVMYYIVSFLPKRKRKKNQRNTCTFTEWLMYKKYRDFLPKSLMIYYFSIFLTFLILIVLIVILHTNGMPESGRLVLQIYFFANSIVNIIMFSVIRLSEIIR